MVVDKKVFFLIQNFKKEIWCYTHEDALTCKVLTFSLFMLQVLGCLISVQVVCLFGCLYLFSFSPFFPLLSTPEVSCAWSSCAHLLSPRVTLPFRAILQKIVWCLLRAFQKDKKIHFHAIDVIHTLFIIQMLSLCTVLALNWTRKNFFFFLLVLILIERGHTFGKIVFPYCFPLFISPPVLIFRIIFFPKGKWRVLHLSSVNSLPPTLVSISACVHHKALVLLLLLIHVSVALESHSESALIMSKACGLFVAFWSFLSLFSCFCLVSYSSENCWALSSSWWKVSCVGKHH